MQMLFDIVSVTEELPSNIPCTFTKSCIETEGFHIPVIGSSSIALILRGKINSRRTISYVLGQFAGAIVGCIPILSPGVPLQSVSSQSVLRKPRFTILIVNLIASCEGRSFPKEHYKKRAQNFLLLFFLDAVRTCNTIHCQKLTRLVLTCRQLNTWL